MPNYKPLFTFEMANNHMGDVEHGIRIIRELHEVSKDYPEYEFAVKFQYRQLDTFIHPDFSNRTDLKFVKRFSETRLTEEQFLEMKEEIEKCGFKTMCTPFDEPSVDLIEKHGYDIVKIASCSLTDWPLLERIARVDKPIIASTAGATLEEIENVVSFFLHREKSFSLMHCVAEYPTLPENMQLNQINLLQYKFPNIRIGFSTHEDPNNVDTVKIAIGKGVTMFEKHVGVKTEKYDINGYSAQPHQIAAWLAAAKDAFKQCGIIGERYEYTEKEKNDLRALRRAVFAKNEIKAGEIITSGNCFFAMPSVEGQILANDVSKYTQFIVKKDIKPNTPVMFADVKQGNIRAKVADIITQVQEILDNSDTVMPENVEFELSHHYGIERFHEWGATIVNCVNREYCKKLIILVPGQKHPEHCHKKKEETFHVLWGEMTVSLRGVEQHLKKGDMLLVERGALHSFMSETGVVFEEISTTHYKNDSFYSDKRVAGNLNRKNQLTYWKDLAKKKS